MNNAVALINDTVVAPLSARLAVYVQVERRRDPSLNNLPVAVVQYNPYEAGGVSDRGAEENRRENQSNGSLIAVS